MMLDDHCADIPDAGQTIPAYGATSRWSGRQKGKRFVSEGSGKTDRDGADQGAADWRLLLGHVRDHQDRAAFAELFRHFAPRVKGYLMKSGATAALAEECAQDVMATLWQKAHLFDPARASVATWVFTIARNRRIDILRKERRVEPEDLPWGPEPEPDQAEAFEVAQETRRLGKAIAQLPENQRVLIERAYFGDLSHSEIASETGLPLGTIKSRIRLALERLRHQMS